MSFRSFPPAAECTPEQLLEICDLVRTNMTASYDLAGSREHIEAVCRLALSMEQDIAQARSIAVLGSMQSDGVGRINSDNAALERDNRNLQLQLAAVTNDRDRLTAVLDKERNDRQVDVLDRDRERQRADNAEAVAEVFETISKATLALIGRPSDSVTTAELVAAVDGRLSRALVRERVISKALGSKLEECLAALEAQQATARLNDSLRSATTAITGKPYEVVAQDLDAELADHRDVGPLHHARDQRDPEVTP